MRKKQARELIESGLKLVNIIKKECYLMPIHESSDRNKPLHLLLPSMYVNGTDLFHWFYPEFGDAYYYIYPDVSGTGKDKV